MMDLRNSRTADVAEVQKSISSERLEGLKWSSMDGMPQLTQKTDYLSLKHLHCTKIDVFAK